MSTIDVGTTIAPKSDQLNADDLIAGPIVIKITKVTASPGSVEQPVAIYFEGDGGKPWKPCKSMRRLLVSVWGRDGSEYVGRRLTLYRDPNVTYGGIAVGGIRISHMSDIDAPITTALTTSRTKRQPVTVKPLAAPKPAAPPPAPAQNSAPDDPAGADAGPFGVSPPPNGPAPPQPELLTLLGKDGKQYTLPLEKWRNTLVNVIETRPYDQARAAWLDNKQYVDDAYLQSHAASEAARAVEVAWRKRERDREAAS